MRNPRYQLHRPNLGQWEIQRRSDDYAKHRECGGLIASPLGSRALRCLTCKQKAGKMAKAHILAETEHLQEHITGAGMQTVYYTAPEEEETGEGERHERQMGAIRDAMLEAIVRRPRTSAELPSSATKNRKRARKSRSCHGPARFAKAAAEVARALNFEDD